MSQQSNSKQSIIIGALAGALVLSIGISAFLYFQSKNQSQAIVQETLKEVPQALQSPSNEAALKELFGVSDPSGKVKTAKDKLTKFWFEKIVKINNKNFLVKFFATQSLDSAGNLNDCHACSVDIGAITYTQNANQWEVVSKQPRFGTTGQWGDVGEVKPEVLQLSSSSVAILLESSSMHFGVMDTGKTLFAFAKNSWIDAGYIQTDSDNSGQCDDETGEDSMGPCYSYKGVISIVKGSASEFPDILVSRSGTESIEHKGAPKPAANVIYSFRNGSYINPSAPE